MSTCHQPSWRVRGDRSKTKQKTGLPSTVRGAVPAGTQKDSRDAKKRLGKIPNGEKLMSWEAVSIGFPTRFLFQTTSPENEVRDYFLDLQKQLK